jgi:hypothetical protein
VARIERGTQHHEAISFPADLGLHVPEQSGCRDDGLSAFLPSTMAEDCRTEIRRKALGFHHFLGEITATP